MAETDVLIDGRSYSIACDEGQEPRVQLLGRYVDQRLNEISNGSGASSKSQLMVLTALLLADEVFDLRDHLQQLSRNNEELRRTPRNSVQNIVHEGLDPADEKQIMDVIGKLSSKVDGLAKRVQKS